jgi:hypothetical protein
MLRFARHWPILIGAAVIAAAVFLAARHSQGPTRRPPNQPGELATSEPVPPPPQSALTPIKPARGSLTVTLTANTGYIGGHVVVVDQLGAAERQVEVKGDNGRATTQLAGLAVGPKRVVFMSFYGHMTASGDADVAANREATCTIALRSGGSVRGVVVDALLQPLEGAHVVVQTDALLASPNPSRPILETSRGFYGGIPGNTSQSHTSYTLMSDGSMRRGAFTDKKGRFTIEALAGSAVSATVSFKKTSATVACALDRETMIILPVYQADSSAARRTFEEFSATFARIMQQLTANPASERAYLDELRAVLYRMIEDSNLSAEEKLRLKKLADETCEDEAKIKERIRK